MERYVTGSDAVYCNDFDKDEAGYHNFQKENTHVHKLKKQAQQLKFGKSRSSKTPVAKPRSSKNSKAKLLDSKKNNTKTEEEEIIYECVDNDYEEISTKFNIKLDPITPLVDISLNNTGANAELNAPVIPAPKPTQKTRQTIPKSPKSTPTCGKMYDVAHMPRTLEEEHTPLRTSAMAQKGKQVNQIEQQNHLSNKDDQDAGNIMDSGFMSDPEKDSSEYEVVHYPEPGYVSAKFVTQPIKPTPTELEYTFDVGCNGGRFSKLPWSIYVPENALPPEVDVNMSIKVSNKQDELPKPPFQCSIVSKKARFKPHALEFRHPVTLYLELDSSVVEEKVAVFYSNTAEDEPCHWEVILPTDTPTNPKRPCILCTSSRSITAIMPTFCEICVGKLDGCELADVPGVDLFTALILETEHTGKAVVEGPCMIHATILLSYTDNIQHPNIVKRGKLQVYPRLGHLKITTRIVNENWKLEGNSWSIIPEIILRNGQFQETNFSFCHDDAQTGTIFAADFRLHQQYSKMHCESILQEKRYLGNLPQKNMTGQVFQVSSHINEPLKSIRKPILPLTSDTTEKVATAVTVSRKPKIQPKICTIDEPRNVTWKTQTVKKAGQNVKSLTQKFENLATCSNNTTVQAKPKIPSSKPKPADRKPSKRMTYHELPEQVKLVIAEELDVKHPIGHDWRMLVEYLGIGNKVDLYTSRAELYKQSPTTMALKAWTAQTGGNLDVLEGVLKSMDREHVARHILSYTSHGSSAL